MHSLVRPLRALALLSITGAALVFAPAGYATLVAPVASSPCSGNSVDRLGAFSWNAVTGADHYEFQIAGDAGFTSPPLGSGLDDFTTKNTRASLVKTLPNGAYYWRVRSVSASVPAVNSAWSATCSFQMAWTDTPNPQNPANGATISYPTPLLIDWTAVNGAAKYALKVSQSPDLSSPVIDLSGGSAIVATAYSPGSRLAAGTYYWGVTPIDAEGHPGAASTVWSFVWDWPSTATTLSVTDLDPSAQVYDPQFAWTAIPGAASYEIEINSDVNFSPGNKVCCDNTTIIGTSFSPSTLLPADTYYWRIRAKDPSGHFGAWVVAPDNADPASTFTINYDNAGISNLTMVDPTGVSLGSAPFSTDTPIVTWAPTPGAASYQVDVVHYSGGGCNWTDGAPTAWHVETAATSWTPLGDGLNAANPFPNPHGVASDQSGLTAGWQYCVRVRARRNVDTQNNQVYGAYTQLGGVGNPAFTFTNYPVGSACTAPCNSTLNIGAGDYVQPAATGNTSLPYFTWNPISGIQSYFVIVATDTSFQHVIDEGFTHIPAYSPRGGSPVTTYPNTSTNYAWAVLPETGFNGGGTAGDPTPASSYPQTFDLQTPAPTLTLPADSATVSTQPTFEWSPVNGAYQYKLLVSSDSSFGTLVGNNGAPFLTSATSLTGTNFPASAHLYWKVQALDRNNNGMAWSPVRQFQKTLAAPAFTGNGTTYTNPSTGDAIPVFQWDAMPGAVAYDVHVQYPNNSASDFNGIDTTAFTPSSMTGTGVFTWSVRAEYPTGNGNVASAYAPAGGSTFDRTIHPPTGELGTVGGTHQVVLSWTSKDSAKSYKVQLSTSDTFSSVFEEIDTENTVATPTLMSDPYVQGGSIYWRIAAIDADNNQGAWSATQTLSMPKLIHLSSSVGAVLKGTTVTLTITAKDGSGHVMSGVLVKDSGAGVIAASHTTGSTGKATFKVHPTKSGSITFTGTKSGALTGTVKVSVF